MTWLSKDNVYLLRPILILAPLPRAGALWAGGG